MGVTVQLREQQKTPLWRNATFIKWATQLFVLSGVVAMFVLLANRAFSNFEASGTTFSWDWLTDPSDFLVFEGIDLNPDSGIRALAVGVVNTLRITFFGIIGATILGTVVGVGRLSNNWIVNKVSTFYVETIRNVPLLLQMFFWNAVAISLPGLVASDIGSYWFKASNKGFAFAWASWQTGFLPWVTFLIFGTIAAVFVSKYRIRVQEKTGQPPRNQTYAFGTFLLFAIVGWFAWPVLSFMRPVFEAIATFVRDLPPVLVPITFAVLAVAASGLWIRNFFESRRTPAGFGKLTDDDWFRVIFIGISGIVLAFLSFAITGITMTTVAGEVLTIAELALKGLGNFFDWLARGFTSAGSQPLNFTKATVVQKGNFVQYGDTGAFMTVPFFAVWFAVTLYTGSFIAEIVRGGILAVPKGQTEASQAVGMKRSQFLRFIILPQAFRVILPPMGNQYLNLFKNTSLGTAVAYAEIVAVGSTLMNKNGQTLPITLVWMAFFLTGSLLISMVVNYYNRKLQLVER